jgi:hypothetical protein
MPQKWLRKLAGSIVIELLCVAGLIAADADYRAGTAVAAGVKALALEDRRGNRAVIAEAGGEVSRQLSDVVAATVMKEYELDRGFLLLRGTGPRRVTVLGVLEAIRAAFNKLAPVALRSDGQTLYAGDACVTAAGELETPCSTKPGSASVVRAPIRAAFQMVELSRGLKQRDEIPRRYPVQAIAFGKTVAILALGGDAPAAMFRRPGVIVSPFSNDAGPFPEDPRVGEAIQQVLARIGR